MSLRQRFINTANIKGDFPHKTAATRAGLGWIGRHCQLISRKFGSWIRLGTVFTDMARLVGKPIERSFCVAACVVSRPVRQKRYGAALTVSPSNDSQISEQETADHTAVAYSNALIS